MNKTILYFLLLTFVTACSQSVVESVQPTPQIRTLAYFSPYMEENYGVERCYRISSPECDIYNIVNISGKPFYKGNILLHEPKDISFTKFDNDWHIPHQIIQANHAKITEEYWIPVTEQHEAYMMLKKYLFKESLTSDVQEAISIYMDWLFKNESPEIGIMRIGLDKLNGYWSAKKMRQSKLELDRLTKRLAKGRRKSTTNATLFLDSLNKGLIKQNKISN